MGVIRSLARKTPGLKRVYMGYLDFIGKSQLKGKAADEVFTEIYKQNRWGSEESVSGPGSVDEQTRAVLEKMPQLLSELGIKSMLDIPCGDFNWLKNADLGSIDYTGADIVDEIVARNRESFERDNVSFQRLNLLSDQLPKVDLILCRDCLVHFSFADISTALENIRRSGATYLLTTSFPKRTKNRDIVTGQWRPLNLEVEPFRLPNPVAIIDEECTEDGGRYADKSLCLWRIDDLMAAR
jgi:hypothetical protein